MPTRGENKVLPENKEPVAVKTGDFREPKKCEWYLSGAIPEAYRAIGDMTGKYYILKLVGRGES